MVKKIFAHVALYAHAHYVTPVLNYVCQKGFQHVHKQQHGTPQQHQVHSTIGNVVAYDVARNKRKKQVARRNDKRANHIYHKQTHVRLVIGEKSFYHGLSSFDRRPPRIESEPP